MKARTFTPSAALANFALLVLFACGGESGPVAGALSDIVVTPDEPQLFTSAPGNTVDLMVVGKDEDGYPLTGGDVRFASSAPSVATVTPGGTVTAVAPGTTQIDTWLTLGETTLSAATQVKVSAGE